MLLLCGAIFVGGVAAGDETPHTHASGTPGADITWTAWDSTKDTKYQTKLPTTEGNYYLTADVTLSDTWYVPTGKTVNLCLNGWVIKKATKAPDNFSLIYVQSGAILNLYDCDTTTKHYFTVQEGGLWKLDDTPTDNAVKLENITSYPAQGTVIEVTGGCITGGNTASTHGGGVYVTGTGSKFTMFGGTIVGNTASGSNGGGGGVYVDDYGTFNMSGGNITGNSATEKGGGVCVDSGTFNVSGSPVIRDNTKTGGTANNVYLDNSKKITIPSGKPLSPAARIGVYPAGGAALGTPFTDGWTSSGSSVLSGIYAVFTADNVDNNGRRTNWPVVETAEGDSKGELKFQTNHQHDGGTTAWTSTTTLPTSEGSYFLTADVTLSDTWSVPGTTNLCLNGYNIVRKSDLAETTKFSLITIGTGCTLNLYDCGTNTQYFNVDHNTGLWTLANGTTDDSVTGGCITGGSAGGMGGGVYVWGGGRFNMSGGNIVGNTATKGGGVYVTGTGSTFTMSGGNIVGNSALGDGFGGGVYVCDSGTFNMSGTAEITGNSAGYGGGVYVSGSGSKFEMSGGNIVGNSAPGDGFGGGVCVVYSGTFTMQDSTDLSPTHGTITGNTARTYGGGVYVGESGTFNMSGTAEITGNSAPDGGGVYVGDSGDAYGTFNVSGAPVISGNKNGTGDTATDNNVYLSGTNLLKLVGPLTSPAEIHITSPVAAGKFGEVDTTTPFTPLQSHADHFVADSSGVAAELVGKGSGSYQLNWVAVKTSVDFPTISSKTYTGETQTADISEPSDYTVTANNGGVNVGSYPVTLTLKEPATHKWSDGTVTAEKTVADAFKIVAKSLSAASIESIPDQTWTGSEINIDNLIVVKDGAKTLVKGTDYTVTSGNSGTNVGTYTLTLTGNGNYKETATKTWNIVSQTYAITTSVPSGHGTITVPTNAAAESEVTVIVNAESGYELDSLTWIPEGGNPTDITAEKKFTMPAKAVTVTAEFKPQRYIITYKDEGDQPFSGSNIDSLPKTHTYGTETTLIDGTKTSYSFVGWFKEQECSGEAVTTIGATDYAADFTLYAKWTKNSSSGGSYKGTSVWATQTYLVTFSMNGHGAEIPAQYVTAGSRAEVPVPAPAADGFVFSGWYTDQGCTVLYDFSTPVAADLTLYAGWNAVTPAVPARETPAGKSPAPVMGVIAGLGAGAVVLCLRRK